MASVTRWIISGMLCGLLAPTVWFLVHAIVPSRSELQWRLVYPVERAVEFLWPSAVWMMATDGIESTARAYLYIALAVAANLLLYAVVAATLWWIKSRIDGGGPR